MKRALPYLCVAVCVIVIGNGWGRCKEPTPSHPPSLSEIVCMGLRSIQELDPSRYPMERRLCLQLYLEAIPADSCLWTFEPPLLSEKVVPVRKAALTEQMVVLLGRKVRDDAQAFANAIPLMIEWEGMSEAPLMEADFVDQWLEKQPMTLVAPFLYLFKAHRLRAGYEAAHARGAQHLWPVLARRYREALDMAKSFAHPLISCIADDLAAQPFVYIEGQGLP